MVSEFFWLGRALVGGSEGWGAVAKADGQPRAYFTCIWNFLRSVTNLTFISSVLADDSAGKSGDLYIRSVCFSPDGKFLATGAEDKQIRVRLYNLYQVDIFIQPHQHRSGTLPKSASATSLTAINKKSTPSTSHTTAASSFRALATKQHVYGIWEAVPRKCSPSTTPTR